MVTEGQKYAAQFFQISGFCCMAPFGKLIMKMLDLEPFKISFKFFIVLILSLLFFIWGIMLIVKGFERVEER